MQMSVLLTQLPVCYIHIFRVDVSAFIIFFNKIVLNCLWMNDALENCYFPQIQFKQVSLKLCNE